MIDIIGNKNSWRMFGGKTQENFWSTAVHPFLRTIVKNLYKKKEEKKTNKRKFNFFKTIVKVLMKRIILNFENKKVKIFSIIF